jgi:hypothetical protein
MPPSLQPITSTGPSCTRDATLTKTGSKAFDGNRKMTNVKMRAVSPLADFSFDYHDLEFVRQASP